MEIENSNVSRAEELKILANEAFKGAALCFIFIFKVMQFQFDVVVFKQLACNHIYIFCFFNLIFHQHHYCQSI